MTRDQKPSVFAVLAHRDFRRLWLADVVSDAGSFITFIALAVYVHDLTGEALAVGFALGLRAIPWFTIGPVAGVIADRVDRRLMMVVCDLARAGLVVLLPFTETAGQAYAISFASGLFGPVFRPARRALIPTVVPEKEFVQAVALGEVTHQVMHTVGPALGGLAVLAVGARNAFFLDAGTFVVSALLVIGVATRGTLRGRPAGLADVRRDLVEGGRHLFGDRLLRSVVLFDSVVLLGYAGTYAAMVVYVRETLGRGAGSYGVLLGAGGLGTALGALLLARRGTRVRRGPALGAAALGSAALGLLAFEPGYGPLIVL
ncbi:MAG: MFS transporter, partial [Chloroflexi bacterium]|nr:MFS transporter [Chloroflexota bacterium]